MADRTTSRTTSARTPAQASAAAVQEIKATLADLTARLQNVERTLSTYIEQASVTSPPPSATVPVTNSAPAPANPDDGTFEAMFLRDVGMLLPGLRDRTARALGGQTVQLTDQEHDQLLRLLDPYLEAGRASGPAARWSQTKLSVWIVSTPTAGNTP